MTEVGNSGRLSFKGSFQPRILMGGPQENFSPQNGNYIPLKHQYPTTKPYSITSHQTKEHIFTAKNLVKNILSYTKSDSLLRLLYVMLSPANPVPYVHTLLLSCKVNLLLLVNITTRKRIEIWRKTPHIFRFSVRRGLSSGSYIFPLGKCLRVHWTDADKLIIDLVSMRKRREQPPPRIYR